MIVVWEKVLDHRKSIMTHYIYTHIINLCRWVAVFLLILWLYMSPYIVYGQAWDGYGTRPLEVLNTVIENADTDNIIETELDKVNNTQIYGSKYKLAGTLESVRTNSAIYLQWIAFAWLTAAAMLIIYNGILLVSTPLSPEQSSKVKSQMIYVIAWLLVLTWFYYMIKILLSILIDLTSAT